MEFVIVGSDQRSDSERVQYWVSGVIMMDWVTEGVRRDDFA